MANQFLIKETMAAMRGLSAAEITALQNGTYEGVQLLGYYEKGDTPTPTVYYYVDLQNEPDPGPDDGGSIVIAYGIKLVNNFIGELNAKYFGVHTLLTNSIIIDNIVKYVNKNTQVTKLVFDTDLTTYNKMVFTRSNLTVDFNNSTVDNRYVGNKYQSIVEFVGSVDLDSFVDVSSDILPYSNKIELTDNSLLNVGDWIIAAYNFASFAASLQSRAYSEYAPFISKVVRKEGNSIYIEHCHQFGYKIQDYRFTEGNLKIGKCIPVVNSQVLNLNLEDNASINTKRLSGVTFFVASDCSAYNINCYKSKSQALYIMNCFNMRTDTISNNSPEMVTAGRGYVVQEFGSIGSKHIRLRGINERHTYDATLFTSDFEVRDSVSINSFNYAFGSHVFTIAQGRFINCKSIVDQAGREGGFYMGNASAFPEGSEGGQFGSELGDIEMINCHCIGGFGKFYSSSRVKTGKTLLHGCTIKNSLEVYPIRLNETAVVTDCDFEGKRIRFYKNYSDPDNTTCFITRSITDIIESEVQSQNTNLIIDASNSASIFNVNRVRINNSQGNIASANYGSVKYLTMNNCDFTTDGDITFPSSLLETNIYNCKFIFNGVSKRFRLLNGEFRVSGCKIENGTIEVGTGTNSVTISDSNISNISLVGGNIALKATLINNTINYFLDNANISNLSFIANTINTGSIIARASVVKLGNRGLSNNTWEDVYIPANTSRIGGIKQATISADTASPPSPTYTQSEIMGLLTEVRDLKTKLRNAGVLAN